MKEGLLDEPKILFLWKTSLMKERFIDDKGKIFFCEKLTI